MPAYHRAFCFCLPSAFDIRQHFLKFLRKSPFALVAFGNSLSVQGLGFHCRMKGEVAQVRFLVGELRSSETCGVTDKKKKIISQKLLEKDD